MLKLLGRNTSGNVQKVIWLLEEIGLPYERQDYGRQFGNTGGDYLALNPTGKVPTIVDDALVVIESNTILRYLSNKFDAQFYPSNPGARATVERWMDWQLASLNGPYLAIFRDAKKEPAERGAGWAADAKELAAQLSILEAALGEDGFIAGAQLSLADMALGTIVPRCVAFPVELPELPKITAWLARLKDRTAYRLATS